jgi:acetyltransferase-like isoleucine patch superfamily enzyme
MNIIKKCLQHGYGIAKDLARMSFIKTIYYNTLSPHVKRSRGGRVIVYKYTKLYFEKNAKIVVEDGSLKLGFGKPFGAKNVTLIRMQANSMLHSYGENIIEYSADVLLSPDALFVMKKGAYINCLSVIRCAKMIALGEDSIVATECHLRDTDSHMLNGVMKKKPTIIGNHVWICARVTVLEGVTISDGSVIGACSLVTHSIPEPCLAYGVPARVMKENVEWVY